MDTNYFGKNSIEGTTPLSTWTQWKSSYFRAMKLCAWEKKYILNYYELTAKYSNLKNSVVINSNSLIYTKQRFLNT